MTTKPGPGLYQPPLSGQYKKLSYSIRGFNDAKIKGTEKSWLTPGPGEYEDMIYRHYLKIRGSKMLEREKRKSFFLQTSVSGNPDPGNYEKPGFQQLNSVPKYSFPKGSREPPLSEGPPGPGAYNFIQQVGNMNDGRLSNKIQIA